VITHGFTYIAVLIFFAGVLVMLEKKTNWKLFKFLPAIVLLYLLTMVLCTVGLWDLKATAGAYSGLKNNILYAMIGLMLLRCDIRQIIRLGPRMLGGFFSASASIAVAFIAVFAIMKGVLGAGAWKPLAALCGSWIGGSGNMIAVQAALDVNEGDMGYALVVDSIDYSIWVMFLFWAISFAPKFNKWTKSSTDAIDEVGNRLEAGAAKTDSTVTFPNLLLLLGGALIVSALAQLGGSAINKGVPFFDSATWTVLIVTVVGLVAAMTPAGKIAGSAELSNVLLYCVIALLASRANLMDLTDGHWWILSGFMILAIHGILLVGIAKLFKLDLFTIGVASLANIGGTASAPILAGAYRGPLVPVGILMALMGYVIGTFTALGVGQVMSLIAR